MNDDWQELVELVALTRAVQHLALVGSRPLPERLAPLLG